MVHGTTERLAIEGGPPVRTTPLPTGFFGLRLVGEEEKAEVLAALDARALSRVSGMTPPTRVAAFEREVCRRVGCRYALAVTSGTAALEVALAACGIGPGDEVIMPALNFISSPETVLRLGAVPVFAEVDEGFGLDPADIAPRITARTRAIMPVHVHGAACRIDAIVAVARRHGLRVIENGAWSLGARFHDQAIGTFGDAGTHSLQSVKVITAGEGGVVLTADPLLYERAARYHNHGNLHRARIPDSLADEPNEVGAGLDAGTGAGREPEVAPFIGAAFRMNELTAAVALAQARKLPEILDRTRRAQRTILAGLRAVRDGFDGRQAPYALRDVPDPAGDCGIAVGLLLPNAERCAAWQAALGAEGIRVGPLYGGRPVYAVPQLRDLRPVWTNGAPLAGGLAHPFTGSPCPRTEDLLARTLVLSVTPDYTRQDAQDVVHAVRKVATGLP